MIRVAVAVAACAAATMVWAQQPAARPAPRPAGGCQGQLVVMRISQLTANGTLAGFQAAARAQQAWYASKGHKADRVIVAPIWTSGAPSPREFVTLFVRAGNAGQPPRDDGWSAFVEKYKANARIDSEARFCLPVTARVTG